RALEEGELPGLRLGLQGLELFHPLRDGELVFVVLLEEVAMPTAQIAFLRDVDGPEAVLGKPEEKEPQLGEIVRRDQRTPGDGNGVMLQPKLAFGSKRFHWRAVVLNQDRSGCKCRAAHRRGRQKTAAGGTDSPAWLAFDAVIPVTCIVACRLLRRVAVWTG